MPYIRKEERKKYKTAIASITRMLQNADMDKIDGEVNYVVTKIFKDTYRPRYFSLNRAMGVLECIKQEFYRRVVAPYEDVKRQENGDV